MGSVQKNREALIAMDEMFENDIAGAKTIFDLVAALANTLRRNPINSVAVDAFPHFREDANCRNFDAYVIHSKHA